MPFATDLENRIFIRVWVFVGFARIISNVGLVSTFALFSGQNAVA